MNCTKLVSHVEDRVLESIVKHDCRAPTDGRYVSSYILIRESSRLDYLLYSE